ncbi:MAG: hypothetical protein ACI8PQ_002173, partial [Planctomycetota bacterium]
TNCLARRRVLRVAVPTRVVPTTQPGDLWGPSEELLFFNGLLDAISEGQLDLLPKPIAPSFLIEKVQLLLSSLSPQP